MGCQCGSQKKQGAVDFINTNQIGALCVVFGAEGNLCRLLDLIPELIEKVRTRNFSNNNTLNILEEMLKKVAKKTVGIIWDELTGQIDVSQFCQNSPPPLPEDITYYDVFQFFGSVVPILSYFFDVNDILIGNETKLLDKVVGFWLYQKWYENCECSPCPPNTPPPPPGPPQLFPKCPAGTERDRAVNTYGVVELSNNQVVSYNLATVYETEFVIGANSSGLETVGVPEVGQQDGQGIQQFPFTIYIATEEPDEFGNGSYNTINGVRVVAGSRPTYIIPPCRPIPPPPPPPDFCSLFPNDPLCAPPPVYGCTDPQAQNYNPDATVDDGSCDYSCISIGIAVEEFVDCFSDRQNKTVFLYDSGDLVDIEVVEFSVCGGDRQTKTVQLYNCTSAPILYGCTDANAINFNPLATNDDGSCIYGFDCASLQDQFTLYGTNDATYFKENGWDLESALQGKLNELANTQAYLDHPECVEQFNNWYIEAFNAVAYA